MKPSELRDKTDEELNELETDLRGRLVKLEVARATSRATNTSEFPRIRKDIARIKTILHERATGLRPAAELSELP
jgi:large subunit ribosomal protein L29